MNGLIPDAMAQSAGSPQAGISTIIMMVVFIGVFYFLLIRPQQKKAKEHQAMVTRLSVGDEVVLLGSVDRLAVDAREHAALSDTVVYEILCGISKRVPRKYC